MYDVKKKPTKLKPCPFCGGEAAVVINVIGYRWVRCKCGVTGPSCKRAKDAAEFWNRRKP